jgi:O-antigen ligase
MHLTFGLFVGTIVVLGVLVSSLIPATLLLGAAAIFASMQIYTVSTAGVYFSVSHLASLGGWRFFARGPVCKEKWYIAIVMLVGLQIVAMFWSPNPVLALRTAIYTLPFLFMVPGFVILYLEKPKIFRLVILLSLGFVGLESLLVIAFRVLPSLEARFLSSIFGRFFVSPNIIAELTNGAYTVFDPGKAGGFFVNANVAAAFMGFSGALAWFWAPSLKAPWLRWNALFIFFSIPFTGSKAGVIIGLGALVIYVLTQIARTRKVSLAWVAAICFGLALAIPIGILVLELISKSQFIKNSGMTLEIRLAIWDFAFQILRNHPLEGLGFGGWELEWPQYAAAYGYSPFFPPHNAFVALFAQTGFLGPLLGLFFVSSVLWFLWRVSRTANEEVHMAALGSFLGLLWLFVQALGENYGLLGEPHMTPLMALALAYIYVLSQHDHAGPESGTTGRNISAASF